MSTKYSALSVVLEEPMSEESITYLIQAIHLLRGVLSVTTLETDILAEHVGAMRERSKIQQAIWDALDQRDHAA